MGKAPETQTETKNLEAFTKLLPMNELPLTFKDAVEASNISSG